MIARVSVLLTMLMLLNWQSAGNDLSAQSVNVYYPSDARVVRTRVGRGGSVRYLHRRYLPSDFYNTLNNGIQYYIDSNVAGSPSIPAGVVDSNRSARLGQAAAAIEDLKSEVGRNSNKLRSLDQSSRTLLESLGLHENSGSGNSGAGNSNGGSLINSPGGQGGAPLPPAEFVVDPPGSATVPTNPIDGFQVPDTRPPAIVDSDPPDGTFVPDEPNQINDQGTDAGVDFDSNSEPVNSDDGELDESTGGGPDTAPERNETGNSSNKPEADGDSDNDLGNSASTAPIESSGGAPLRTRTGESPQAEKAKTAISDQIIRAVKQKFAGKKESRFRLETLEVNGRQVLILVEDSAGQK